MTERQFLVGDWYSKELDANCPISKCGLTDVRYASEVGQDFDDRAYTEYDIDKGLIAEEKARNIWKGMIIYYDDVAHQDHSEFCDMYKDKLHLAEVVANKLNW